MVKHQRKTQQQARDADDHRHDGGHGCAAARVAAKDLARVGDEAVDLVSDRRRDLLDDGAPQARPVLEQVVHDHRAEDQGTREADQRVDAGNDLRDEALCDRRGRLLGRRPGILERLLVDGELVDRVVDRRVDRVADPVRLLDHAPYGGDHDEGHQGEQAEDDQAGAEGRLEPASFELPDQRLEDHGENGREEQRKHDLAHGPERDDHDDSRRHDADEAPGPDSESGHRVHVFTPGVIGRAPRDERGWSATAGHHPYRVIAHQAEFIRSG